MKGLFITGTGTGVGKTIVTASLIRALAMRNINVQVSKPFATGVPAENWKDDDPAFLDFVLKQSGLGSLLPGQRLSHPLAPAAAAELEDRELCYESCLRDVKVALDTGIPLLVEGVGGAAVPITNEKLISDLIADTELPVLIVARTDLGTINHTLLTIEHLQNLGCQISGIVYMRHKAGTLGIDEETSPDWIDRFSGVPSFGRVPWVQELSDASTAAEAFAVLPADCEAIVNIVQRIAG